MGRLSTFSEKKAAQILQLMADGASLNAAAKQCGIAESTVREWKQDQPEFAANYARAVENRAEFYFERILNIANGIDSSEQANIARVQIDAIKWATSKLNPKRYGDKVQQELSGPDGGPLQAEINVNFVRPDAKSNG